MFLFDYYTINIFSVYNASVFYFNCVMNMLLIALSSYSRFFYAYKPLASLYFYLSESSALSNYNFILQDY